jgi:hypothetical protein
MIGMFGLSVPAGVLAAYNTQYCTGNGTTEGEIDNNDCEKDSSAHQLWIWTGTGSNVWISVDGELVQGDQQGNGAYHFETGWHDIGDLTPGVGGNVFVTYDGAADGNAVVTLSHGCPGEETTTTSSSTTSESTTSESTTSESTTSESTTSESTTSESTTSESTTSESTTSESTTSESTTTTTTFTGGTGGETDVPTQPNTAAVGTGGPSHPSNNAWLLVLALGGLLTSVVLLTPAGAKSKR